MESWNHLTDWLSRNWALLLPLLPGMVALGWLMPQPRRQPLDLALGLASSALAFCLLLWLVPEGGAVYFTLFCIFAALAIVSALCMIAQHNPVYAALWFALTVLSTCGLFLLQVAPFVAAATIIVYAGAINVTFLFVIMLAQQEGATLYDQTSHQPRLTGALGFLLLGCLLYVMHDFTENKALLAASYPPVADAVSPAPTEHTAVANATATAAADHALNPVVSAAPTGTALADHSPAPGDSRETRAAQNAHAPLKTATATEPGTPLLETVVIAAPAGTSVVSATPFAGTVNELGHSLYGEYLIAVELAGTLLTLAVVGAIAIAPRREQGK